MFDLEEYLKQMETLVNIDCGSHDPEGINKVADYLEQWYREIGWTVKRHDLGPETGNLLEISNRPADHYDAMFVGHMDTVFPAGTCAERPFRTDLKFVLDWQFLYDFASGGGRWILEERPLLLYRIHDGAATKECIEDHVREREEAQMFQTVLPFIPARQILRLYRRSYETYED